MHRDFFKEIKSSLTYFNYILPIHQLNIIEIFVYYKIVKNF